MKVLLLGFEPFLNHKINSSHEVCRRISQTSHASKLIIPDEPLPVDRLRAPRIALHLYRQTNPDIVVSLGMAAGSPGIRFERFAFNGFLDSDSDITTAPSRLHPAKADAYQTRVPVEKLAARLLHKGIPVTISNDPGLFVCNALYFSLLSHDTQRNKKTWIQFIHLPLPASQANVQKRTCLPSMPLALQASAVLETVRHMQQLYR